MFAKISEALRIFRDHFWLIAAIVLTVWLPGNIIISYTLNSEDVFGAFKMTAWIEGVFGPIYIGALTYALLEIKSGRVVTYKGVMAIGIQKWGRLFIANFVAGFLILLGFIALVVPGLILAVRYSLLSAAVIIEDKNPSESRKRSAELTAGRRWQIFWSAFVFFIGLMFLSIVVHSTIGLFESLDTLPVTVFIDSLLDVVFAILQIILFLFYWEAVQGQDEYFGAVHRIE